eukprot:9476388-Pyramimonas_sp.AAC.1
MDAKTDEFGVRWLHPMLTYHDHASIINDVREHAAAAPTTNWTLDDLNYSLRCPPGSGEGTDKFASSGVKRPPRAGRQQLVNLLGLRATEHWDYCRNDADEFGKS